VDSRRQVGSGRNWQADNTKHRLEGDVGNRGQPRIPIVTVMAQYNSIPWHTSPSAAGACILQQMTSRSSRARGHDRQGRPSPLPQIARSIAVGIAAVLAEQGAVGAEGAPCSTGSRRHARPRDDEMDGVVFGHRADGLSRSPGTSMALSKRRGIRHAPRGPNPTLTPKPCPLDTRRRSLGKTTRPAP